VDRQGERRLMKRTARKKLGRALKAFSDWVRTHRHLPTKELFRQVAWKLRGHFNYFGLPGNSPVHQGVSHQGLGDSAEVAQAA